MIGSLIMFVGSYLHIRIANVAIRDVTPVLLLRIELACVTVVAEVDCRGLRQDTLCFGLLTIQTERTKPNDFNNCLVLLAFLSSEDTKRCYDLVCIDRLALIHLSTPDIMLQSMYTIYVRLCLEHAWKGMSSTAEAKTINGDVPLHALVDGKKIIITESTVRRDPQLEDAEGVNCLPNSTIFKQLTLMGSKTTAWNEFSSTMASAIICLDTNQNVLEQQLDDLSNHKRIYIAPSYTKKIFGNMKMVGKGFSSRVTPLFPAMVVQNQSELSKGSANPTDPHHIPTIIQSLTQPQKTQKPRKPKIKDTQVPQPSNPSKNVADEAFHKELGDSLVRAATIASSLEAEQDSVVVPGAKKPWGILLLELGLRVYLNILMIHCSQEKVLDLEKTKTTQANEIASLKRRVKKLEKKRSSRTHKLKRLYKVGLTTRVESSGDEEDLGEDASKQGRRINAINGDEDIILVNVQDDADNEMFDVNVLNGEEVFVAGQNKNVVEEVVDAAQDKGKGIMIEEPVKPMKKKDQISFDEEVALKLQAEFDKKERLAREKAEKEKEANIALIEE
ncbi:hypothetical protein Tco_0305207 [Tanacetum coccineum]